MIPRNIYLNKIKSYLDKPIIKVLIGIRRCGKSTILLQLINFLKENHVNDKNIIYINKESLEFDEIKNYQQLNRYVSQKLKNRKGKRYIIIDEIQEIENWEKAIISFFSQKLGDIIITGSNSQLLSSEIATLLSGRYIEIPVRTLSFKEFLSFRKTEVRINEIEFLNYLKYGGMPAIHFFHLSEIEVFEYLNSLLNTLFLKDIVARYKIREVVLLENIVKYLMDNCGQIVTAKRISDYLKSQKVRISVDTVQNYFKYLESAFLFSRISRYDMKGKRYMEFSDKFYMGDIGLRNGFIGYSDKDISGILENAVYNELTLRGYKVSIGNFGNKEIDLIAEKKDDKRYYQVCYILESKKTIEREFGNLKLIDDNYRKIVLSMDKLFQLDYDGIEHKYLIDFLLE